MAQHEPTLQELRKLWSLRGLDADEYDMETVHVAWCSLHRAMQRMQPVYHSIDQTPEPQPAGTQPQCVFDPSTLAKRGDA